MRSIRVAMILVSALAAVIGCSTASYDGDENSPYFLVPVGSHLTLKQELPIAANQLGVFIQDGRILPSPQLQAYHPYCKFDLYHLSEVARTVAPDEWTVLKTVQEEIQDANSASAGGSMYARVALVKRASMSNSNGGPIIQRFSTRMDLRSDKQPDVFRLTCSQLGLAGVDRQVTIAEIRKTLSGLITLQLAKSGP